MGYPQFGTSGTVEEETKGYATEELEYRDGFSTDVFDLKHTDTLTKSNPSYCANTYGIAAKDVGVDGDEKNSLVVPLETVTLTEEEEVTEPHAVAVGSGSSPDLGDKLTYTNGLIFHRLRKTLTINGKGDPPAGLGTANRGDTYSSSIQITPAVFGSADGPVINEGSGFYLRRVEIRNSNTDWQKFVLELVKYTPNNAAGAENNMLDPSLFVISELQAMSDYFKLSRTITLNGDGPANVEETAEIYDDDTSA